MTAIRNGLFRYSLIIAVTACGFPATAQETDSLKINTPLVISHALEGNMPKALEVLNTGDKKLLIRKHVQLRKGLNDRFGYETDRSDYLLKHHSEIDGLLEVYRDYWRSSFLDFPTLHDSLLKQNLVASLQKNYKAAGKLKQESSDEKLDRVLRRYIASKGYYSTGYGKVGRFRDLLVWRRQKDTIYHFTSGKDQIKAKVVFMDDFVSLGWEEYATLDKIFPGGWAKKDALYCVRKAYDLKSESFRISYLAHENRHFQDYRLFPKLITADLEYRAKLTELSLLKDSMWDVLGFFVNNADKATTDSHKLADYHVVHGLSLLVFQKDFEKDMEVWNKLPLETIHKASLALLEQSTKELKAKGKDASTNF